MQFDKKKNTNAEPPLRFRLLCLQTVCIWIKNSSFNKFKIFIKSFYFELESLFFLQNKPQLTNCVYFVFVVNRILLHYTHTRTHTMSAALSSVAERSKMTTRKIRYDAQSKHRNHATLFVGWMKWKWKSAARARSTRQSAFGNTTHSFRWIVCVLGDFCRWRQLSGRTDRIERKRENY